MSTHGSTLGLLTLSLSALAFTAAQLLFGMQYLGLWLSAVAVLVVWQSSSLPVFLISLISIPLGFAFDFFIRVERTFYFYRGGGWEVEELCALTTSILILFLAMEQFTTSRRTGFKVSFKVPSVPSILFIPLTVGIFAAAFFVNANAQTFFTVGFDNAQLAKFPWLEYIALVILFAYASAGQRKFRRWIVIIAGTLYIVTALLASYRMVSIISALSLALVIVNGRAVGKAWPLSLAAVYYLGLSAVAYFRQGAFEVDLAMLIGYQSGRLDNTFTGVIETALIYTSIAKGQPLAENLAYLLGAILPLPNTLIPDGMQYAVDAISRFHLPGGGLFSGFVVYFNFLLLPIVLVYMWYAMKHATHSDLASAAYFILSVTVTRWWLYGPYSLFKFFGVYVLLLFMCRMVGLVQRGTHLQSFANR